MWKGWKGGPEVWRAGREGQKCLCELGAVGTGRYVCLWSSQPCGEGQSGGKWPQPCKEGQGRAGKAAALQERPRSYGEAHTRAGEAAVLWERPVVRGSCC